MHEQIPNKPPKTFHATTIKGDGLLRRLSSDVIITHPKAKSSSILVKAIWDTGATSSVITEKVVQQLGLVSTGMTKMISATETVRTETYVVDIFLHKDFGIGQLSVAKGKLFGDFECLIGMDILTMGDFSITNYEGKTIMSYRYPSQKKVDFLEALREKFRMKITPPPKKYMSKKQRKQKNMGKKKR